MITDDQLVHYVRSQHVASATWQATMISDDLLRGV